MTNYDKIKSMKIKKLAEFLIREIGIPTYANDGDGYIDEWEEDKFLCSDGKMFDRKDFAICHELKWLNEEERK